MIFRGKLLRLEVETWVGGEREVVRHPGACGVVAVTPAGEVLLVKQFREPLRRVLLEIPAGVFDREGEDAAGCAIREVMEETGYAVSDLEPLAVVHTSPGFTDERIELFLARAAERPGADAEAGMEVVRLPVHEAVAAVREGAISDAKTAVAVLLGARRLAERRPPPDGGEVDEPST